MPLYKGRSNKDPHLQELQALCDDCVQITSHVCILLRKALHFQILQLWLAFSLPFVPVPDLRGRCT